MLVFNRILSICEGRKCQETNLADLFLLVVKETGRESFGGGQTTRHLLVNLEQSCFSLNKCFFYNSG